jgi:Aspartyl protease/SdrD B-like domain/Domain of unknown function (DUF4214)
LLDRPKIFRLYWVIRRSDDSRVESQGQSRLFRGFAENEEERMRFCFPPARKVLLCEELERRLVLSNLIIPVQYPFGDQIVTVQAYNDPSRTAFGIFDTGSSALTFSARDQASFTAAGNPIPIKVPGGAVLDGVGGVITGDVSQPGTILATGLSAVTMSLGSNGSASFTTDFTNGYAAVSPGIQAFVGTASGSPALPTITGTPILNGGYAALIAMQGASFDFSAIDPGLDVSLPDVKFVDAGFQLTGGPQTTAPITIPLNLFGGNPGAPATSVTQAPTSVDSSVTLVAGSASVSNKTFLFDTGAQVTAISPETAVSLGLDLAHPTAWGPVQGIGGAEEVPTYTLDQLDLPFAGGTLELTQVPVSVVNLATGLDGVLGMNLWNDAVQLLYTPQALQVTFHRYYSPAEGPGQQVPSMLQSHGVSFASAIQGDQLPGLGLTSGQINGQAFDDWNRNGLMDPGETGLAGVSVYIDLNNDGQWDIGDPITTTDAEGYYHFGGLLPGDYQVREIAPSGMVLTNPQVGGVALLPGSSVNGVDFGNIPHYSNFNENYLAQLYGDLLDRAPDAAGLQAWLTLLEQGMSTQQVADAFWQSAEHRAIQVSTYYETFLQRTADPAGLQQWVNAFVDGATEDEVELGILSSAEFQASHPDNASYVQALYLDVLGRQADSAGEAAWEQLLAGGMSRAQVASDFLTSTEYYQRLVEALYASLLNRPADAAGEQAWVTLLQENAVALDGAAEAFLNSPEYLSAANV